MLPYLAPSGHNLYETGPPPPLLPDHHDEYRTFTPGLHVARSDRFWAGLSLDLLMEQVFTRGLKTGGALTRGRTPMKQQRVICLLSKPAYAETCHIMQEPTGVQFNSGEQNKVMSRARQTRDAKDTVTILRALTTTALSLSTLTRTFETLLMGRRFYRR